MKQCNDLLTLEEFTPTIANALIEKAIKIKKNPKKYAKELVGKNIGMIFFKPSSRTRVSFESGINQMGGHALYLGTDLHLLRGETIHDTSKVFSRYLDAIVLRTFKHSDCEEFALHSSIPIINGLTDSHHPCQALADLMTVRERFGKLKGKKIVYIGDGNNVLHSLMYASALCGVHIKVVCPKKHLPDKEFIIKAAKLALNTGANIEIDEIAVGKPIKGSCKNAHAVYTDTWVSMGQEKDRNKKLKEFKGFQITQSLMQESKNAIFLHCLPAHRGEEVTDEVMDGKQSAIFDQAENRMHIQKAILIYLLKGKI